MNINGFYRPERCQIGEEYFIWEENNSPIIEYKTAVLVSYRPHPGELLIREDGVTRVIYRRHLYAKKKEIQ
jgi:hypothetical protein